MLVAEAVQLHVRIQLRAEVERWCRELLERSPAYLELSKISSNVWWDMLTPAMEAAKQSLFHLAGGPQMNDGLLSGTLDMANGGTSNGMATRENAAVGIET